MAQSTYLHVHSTWNTVERVYTSGKDGEHEQELPHPILYNALKKCKISQESPISARAFYNSILRPQNPLSGVLFFSIKEKKAQSNWH